MTNNKQYISVSDLAEYKQNLTEDCVEYIFNDCNMFQDATMHVRIMDGTGAERDYIYYVGVNAKDLADIFTAKYEHRLVERPIDLDDPTADVNRIKRRLHAMVCEWIPKYLKTVETYGYTYNPLANVDADEQLAYINSESDHTNSATATNNGTSTHSSHSATNVDTTSTSVAGGNGISTPETNLYETQYDDTGKSDANLKSYTTTTGGNTSHSTANKDNNYSDANGTDTSTDSTTSNSTSGYTRQSVNISKKDNALGFAWDNATDVHIQKHVRVGNIGVTKTTELIESERNTYRSIIHDFLQDAAKEILLPLYKFED